VLNIPGQFNNMKINNFVILGPIDDESPTYWNMYEGWTIHLGEATTFPKDILSLPLPQGSTGMLEYQSHNAIPINLYYPYPGVVMNSNIFGILH